MKNDNANSASPSGTTFAAETPIRATPSAAEEAKAVAKAGVGETAYLVRQQQLARQALSRALGDAFSLGKQAADPGRAMKSHPWMVLAASAVAGFATAAAAVPSKEDQALRKLARLERVFSPNAHANGGPERDGSHGVNAGETDEGGRASIGRKILMELIGVLKPALVSLLTAGISGASAAKPAAADPQAGATSAAGVSQSTNGK